MTTTLDLINAIEAGKTRECERAFADLVQAKVADAIALRTDEVRASMFESEQLDEAQPIDREAAKAKRAEAKAKKEREAYLDRRAKLDAFKPKKGLRVRHHKFGEGVFDHVYFDAGDRDPNYLVRYNSGQKENHSKAGLMMIADMDHYEEMKAKNESVE